MIIERKINRNIIPNNRKLGQKLTYTLLDLICSYLTSDNRMIRNKGYMNIKNLVSLMDMKDYSDEKDIERIDFIKFGLDARLEHDLIKKEQVMDYITSNMISYSRYDDINLQELSNEEVTYVNETVTNLLDTAEFSSYIHCFDDIAREFDNASSYHKKEIVDKWKKLIGECQNKIRVNNVESGEEEIISLQEDSFDPYARSVYDYYSNPSSKLSTGMIGFNHLLGGGFEGTKVYCLYGLQGEGKSTTLLNLALQIKQYNKRYKTKDPTKKPAIVYLTLENSKRETFSRMFSMSTDAGRITDYEVDEAISMMKNNGLVVTDENPIDIIIKYKPNNSIDTSYLYELRDNLSDMGYEVITFIIDYLNLVRSIDRFSVSEERLKLGAVVNEIKSIASALDIPIITASQMNREANKSVDEARDSGKVNLVKTTNRSNLGESMLVLNNLDGCFQIIPCMIPSSNLKYLCMKLVKSRYEPFKDKLDYHNFIYQPYTNMDSIKLVCDVGKEPQYLFDLSEKKVETMTVDQSVNIPDNSNRCGNFIDIESTKVEDTVLNDDGTELDYNPNWRLEPKTIKTSNGQEYNNVDSYPPEQQIRIRRIIKGFKDSKGHDIRELNGISRYSDLYTKLYDPEGSKEERMAYDYSMIYGMSFTKEDYPYLRSHFVRSKQGIVDDNVLTVSPFIPLEEPTRVFVEVPEVDREAFDKYLSSNPLSF